MNHRNDFYRNDNHRRHLSKLQTSQNWNNCSIVILSLKLGPLSSTMDPVKIDEISNSQFLPPFLLLPSPFFL